MTPPAVTRDRVISPVMALALTGVLIVVVSGDVWSFREQTELARTLDFDLPWLLPVVLDGLAAALAAVAFAASLDGRAAAGARLGTALAVTASAASNLAAAGLRLGTESPRDRVALVIAAGIPVAANIAWEVILGELRRQVMRRRGLPAPVPVQWPRVIRVVLAPRSTVRAWRRVVLDLTDPDPRDRVTDPVTPPVTRDPQGHDPVTPVTPRVSDPVTRDPDPVTPPTSDPSDPQGHEHVTPTDPRDPVTRDPVTRDPQPRDRVVTPMTPRSTEDIDQWVTQALATGATRSQVIHAAMTGSSLGTVGPCPRTTVSESTVKRAIRRCTRQEHTA